MKEDKVSITIRIPISLRNRLREEARRKGITLAAHVANIVQESQGKGVSHVR